MDVFKIDAKELIELANKKETISREDLLSLAKDADLQEAKQEIERRKSKEK